MAFYSSKHLLSISDSPCTYVPVSFTSTCYLNELPTTTSIDIYYCLELETTMPIDSCFSGYYYRLFSSFYFD